MDATAERLPADDSVFFGHPRGLGVLAFAEGFIGFSYYGMQSLLVLYMTSQLLRPGHVEHVLGFGGFRAGLALLYGDRQGQALAAGVMGVYSALIYGMPILGGLLADRVLGRTRTIILGGVLMTAGHFMMAFDATFLPALACIVTGSGCTGNIKAQVGALYRPGDLRRADAFQIYTLSVQLAVIVAPLICGALGEGYAWHWGFIAAGIGMLVGLVVYLWGLRLLPPEPAHAGARAGGAVLSGAEWRRLGLLCALLPVLALVAVGNMEIFNGYLVWGQASYALRFFGREMPASWLISLDSIVSTVTLLASVLFWRWWSGHRHNPDEIVKMTIGGAIAASAPLVLAAASLRVAGGQRVGLAWGVGFHVLNDIGFVNVYAIGLALFSRAAPPRLGATVVNAFVLHLFLANLLVGYLAGLLSRMSGAQFWMMHAGLIAAGTGMLALFAVFARRNLAPG